MKYYQKQLALGSIVEFCIVSNAPQPQINQLYADLWHTVFAFEKRCSRFLPASELSFLNRRSGLQHHISPELRDILVAAKTLSQRTDGLFNPFILPALQAAGYVHSMVSGHHNDPTDDHSGKDVPPIDQLEIGDTWARIPFNSAIDLGGCGKGYIADQIADTLPAFVDGFWLSFGGDIIVGGSDEGGTSWKIGIQDARDNNTDITAITVPIGSRVGIATSGTGLRQGIKNGTKWHHIIDPRSLRPAVTDVLTATVCHSSALRADVLASCAVIVGHRAASTFLHSNQTPAALIQYQSDGSLQQTSFGDVFTANNRISTV